MCADTYVCIWRSNRGQPLLSFLGYRPHVFGEVIVFCLLLRWGLPWPETNKQARPTGQWMPRVCLPVSPQHWDFEHMLVCPTLLTVFRRLSSSHHEARQILRLNYLCSLKTELSIQLHFLATSLVWQFSLLSKWKLPHIIFFPLLPSLFLFLVFWDKSYYTALCGQELVCISSGWPWVCIILLPLLPKSWDCDVQHHASVKIFS